MFSSYSYQTVILRVLMCDLEVEIQTTYSQHTNPT